ncbi:unnamed protein product [Mytilus coruscus]|uniref:SAM domain-containing protein n=1 Tax=Mytilus coruscus TaxID=42192 RepID=A0A6J8DQ37_MYTCO|nr:unnamed protein product [Mytilus coruscus]
MDVENWLSSIDTSLIKYADDFRSLDFENTSSLRFFRAKDFDKFFHSVSLTHRRMILHSVEKLQTPDGKKIAMSYLTPEQDTVSDLPPLWEPRHGAPNARTQLFKYKSPLELSIEEMDEKVQCAEVELESAVSFQTELRQKFLSVINNKSGLQCGKCHLRQGHSKKKCPNDKCISAESCDVDKHSDEK